MEAATAYLPELAQSPFCTPIPDHDEENVDVKPNATRRSKELKGWIDEVIFPALLKELNIG